MMRSGQKDAVAVGSVAVVAQPAQLKRAQVPKACGNCRKMHAGCDTQRPCKRCKQNGLESTCEDIPRKKRASRKKKNPELDPPYNSTPPSGSPSPSPPTNLPRHDRPWEVTSSNPIIHETYNASMHPVIPIPKQPTPQTEQTYEQTSTGMTPTLNTGMTPTMTGMSPLFSGEFSISNYPSDNIFGDFAFGTGLTPQNPNIVPNTPNSASNTPMSTMGTPGSQDIAFLIQQINELRESNRTLESKLSGVSHEIGEIKTKKPNSPVSSPIGGGSNSWHSFQVQGDLAISVWKNIGYSSTVLVECNDKFVELLGYPLETLKTNFSPSKLIRKETDPSKNSRDWPKRTQIVTAEGLKDVYLTINPVSDHNNTVKYYVLHILEVHDR